LSDSSELAVKRPHFAGLMSDAATFSFSSAFFYGALLTNAAQAR
jgi:hypothetical protein